MINPKEIKTPQELAEALNIISENEKKIERAPEEYRYVIYARKSTNDEGKQVQSVDQQVDECTAFNKQLGLNVVGIIREEVSASTSGIRPAFSKMLSDMEKGKYEGIIAWHPDRIARNMKDGGMVIDLLDKGVIKDLKFVSFSFTNDTNGKVMLGISFVLSKQYTDKLRTDVNRAIKHAILKGQYFSNRKHGYYKDEENLLRPEEEIFITLKQAWAMRIEGKSLKEIAEFVNSTNYFVRNKLQNDKKTFTMSPKKLSEMFRDPIYAGVLKYGESRKAVSLTEIYNFIPLVSVEEFLQASKYKSISEALRKFRPISNKKYKHILSGKVLCGYCGKPRTSQIVPKTLKNGKKKRYYSYRCDNPECSFKGSSDRAKILIEFAINLLNEKNFDTENAYRKYKTEFKRYAKEMASTLGRQIKSQNRKLQILEENKDLTKETIKNTNFNKSVAQEFEEDLLIIKDKIKQKEREIRIYKQRKEKLNKAMLTYSQFLELFKEMPLILKKRTSLEAKNQILSEILLNCTLKDGQIVSYKLKPPFDELIKTGEFSNGGPSGT